MSQVAGSKEEEAVELFEILGCEDPSVFTEGELDSVCRAELLHFLLDVAKLAAIAMDDFLLPGSGFGEEEHMLHTGGLPGSSRAEIQSC